jgi:hypothetical protein
VEIVFALLVVAAFTYSLRLTRSFYFFVDDWRGFEQGASVRGWFRPYNEQLGVIIIGTYRVLAELFGFAFTPFRVLGMVGLFAVPAAYFLTTRRQFGAVLAALLALPLVWYGRYVSLNPSQLDHFLALLGGIGCAAALNRGRRADWVLAGALAFSLCSGGAGAAVAAACIAHNLCTRAPLRRWLAVLVPTLLWIAWWLIEVGQASHPNVDAMTPSQALRFFRDLSYTPFETTALGIGVLAIVLVAAFVVYGIWTLSHGLDAGANFLAWSIGFGAWAVGLANSRGLAASVTVFRYRYVALVLILLALVPRRPIVWPARFPIDRDRRFVVTGVIVVLALGSARGLAVRDDMHTTMALWSRVGHVTRGETLMVELGPSVVPDKTVLPWDMGRLRAGELRAMFADYGNPLSAGRAAVDQELVEGGVRSVPDGTRRVRCRPLTRPFTYAPAPLFSTQHLWSPRAFTVEVRRFGDHWVRVGTGRPGVALRLVLPGFGVDTPWRIRANGACRVGARAP